MTSPPKSTLDSLRAGLDKVKEIMKDAEAVQQRLAEAWVIAERMAVKSEPTPRVDDFVLQAGTEAAEQSDFNPYFVLSANMADFARALERELAEAKAQLPDGMKDCTILFRECDKGHGWLTATNWIQHDCLICRAKAAERECARVQELHRGLMAEADRRVDAAESSLASAAREREGMVERCAEVARDVCLEEARVWRVHAHREKIDLQLYAQSNRLGSMVHAAISALAPSQPQAPEDLSGEEK